MAVHQSHGHPTGRSPSPHDCGVGFKDTKTRRLEKDRVSRVWLWPVANPCPIPGISHAHRSRIAREGYERLDAEAVLQTADRSAQFDREGARPSDGQFRRLGKSLPVRQKRPLRGGGDEAKKLDLLTRRDETLGNLEHDRPPERRSDQRIRPMWLQGAHRLDVCVRHILDPVQWLLVIQEPAAPRP